MKHSIPIRIFPVLALIVSLPVLYFNCGEFTDPQRRDTTTAASSSSTATVESAEKTISPVAILSSEQILKMMISVTGIESAFDQGDPYDATIIATFNERAGSLPPDQAIDLLTAPALVGITNLASAVCAKLVNKEKSIVEANANDRIYFREFNFTQGPSGVSSSTIIPVLDRMGRNFWRREITDSEKNTIAQELLGAFLTNVNLSDPKQTEILAVAACTAVLSSVESLIY